MKKSNKISEFVKSKFDRNEIIKEESDRNQKKWRTILDMFFCIFVRLFFIGQSIFCIYFLIEISLNKYFLFLIILLVLILVDAFYITIFRLGKEHTW